MNNKISISIQAVKHTVNFLALFTMNLMSLLFDLTKIANLSNRLILIINDSTIKYLSHI